MNGNISWMLWSNLCPTAGGGDARSTLRDQCDGTLLITVTLIDVMEASQKIITQDRQNCILLTEVDQLG